MSRFVEELVADCEAHGISLEQLTWMVLRKDGEDYARYRIARKLIKMGNLTQEQIAEATELPLDTILFLQKDMMPSESMNDSGGEPQKA